MSVMGGDKKVAQAVPGPTVQVGSRSVLGATPSLNEAFVARD